VWIAHLPEGCKDANQTLLEHGKKVLVECIANAEPYPLSALYNSTHYEHSVIDLYDKGFMKWGFYRI
jgi:twinkle protein